MPLHVSHVRIATSRPPPGSNLASGRRSHSAHATPVPEQVGPDRTARTPRWPGFHLIEGMVTCPACEKLVTGNGDRPAAHVTSAGKPGRDEQARLAAWRTKRRCLQLAGSAARRRAGWTKTSAWQCMKSSLPARSSTRTTSWSRSSTATCRSTARGQARHGRGAQHHQSDRGLGRRIMDRRHNGK